LVALLTAGFLLLARLLKLGFLADFLSRTVLIGFLTGVGFQVGIAVLSDMLKLDENRDLLGISAANAAAALSGTFVVNGSPTQTAMVETSGGSSQLAHLSRAWRFRHRSAQRSKTQWR
jgi:MFS superfamily sulfate permease-like transporter